MSSQKQCHVKVAVRCRPMNENERMQGNHSIINTSCLGNEMEVFTDRKHEASTTRRFCFDHVYGSQSTQKEIYEGAVRPIVDDVLDGYCGTIFAYGMTGTGKTFTMEGDCKQYSDLSGVIPRSIEHIFSHLENNGTEHTVRVTCLELHNEELHDMLVSEDNAKQLRLFEDGKRGVVVANLEEAIVSRAADIISILQRASARRHTAETLLNKTSSRSHIIFTITIMTKESTADGEDLLKIGKLNLVDLAGSENIGRSGAREARAREAGLINQSLLTLGRVINALVEHLPHVPYRESKLTRLLQESLGGKAKTCIIATVSPASYCMEETMSTLDYAHRAKNIKNRPEVNQRMTKKALLRELNQEIERLKGELHATREKNGVYLPPDQYESMERELAAKRTRLDEVDTLLAEHSKELNTLKDLCDSRGIELDEVKTMHNETNILLTETRVELEIRTSDLKLAKDKITAQDHTLRVIDTQASDLHDTSKKLHTGLRSAAHDVSELCSKVERQNAASSYNESKGRAYGTHTVGVLSSLMDRVHATAETTSDAVNKWTSTTSGQMDMTRQHTDRMMASFEGLAHVVGNATNQLTNAVVSAVESSNVRINGDVDDMCNGATSALQAIQGHASTLNATVDLLKTTLDTEMASLTQWRSDQMVAMEAEKKEMEQALADHRTRLTEVKQMIGDGINSGITSLEQQGCTLDEAVKKHHEVRSQNEEQLVGDIINLIRVHSDGERRRVDELNAAAQSGLKSCAESMASTRENLCVAVTSECENDWLEPTRDTVDSLVRDLGHFQTDRDRSHTEAQCIADTIAQEITATTTTAVSCHRSTTSAIRELGEEAQLAWATLACDMEVESRPVIDGIASSLDSLRSEVQQACTSQTDTLTALKSEFEAHEQSTTDSSAVIKSTLETVSTEMTSLFNGFKTAPITGNTPVRRNIPIPSTPSTPMPSSKVLEQYEKPIPIDMDGENDVVVATPKPATPLPSRIPGPPLTDVTNVR